MFDLILSNALLKGRRVDVAVQGSRFAAVEPAGTLAQAGTRERLNCSHFLLRPPFYNTHTHQAMTLLRGIDDDCALMDWLTREIWPREARLTPNTVYAGTRLAILEGLKSGCVAFNDMYFHQPAVIRAATEMGVRARVGLMYMDQVSDHIENDATLALRDALPPTIGLSIAPHALYTTSPELLRRVADQAESLGLPLHIHAAETTAETAIAKERFGFDSPLAYLDSCGILRPGTILAHCCHATEADLALIAERGCFVAHCPQSNQKLASGVFPWAKAAAAGVRITIGPNSGPARRMPSALPTSTAPSPKRPPPPSASPTPAVSSPAPTPTSSWSTSKPPSSPAAVTPMPTLSTPPIPPASIPLPVPVASSCAATKSPAKPTSSPPPAPPPPPSSHPDSHR